MSSECIGSDRQRTGERGSIVIMTAIFMLLLFLMLGLCIDVSRIYMVRAELQNGADAAAVSAARELNGGPVGIENAVTRAGNILNVQGFTAKGITISTVEFATTLVTNVNTNEDTTAWLTAAQAQATGTVDQIKYVRVTTGTEATAILFGVAALGTAHNENRNAVAGLSVGINGFCDYYPIAIAKENPTEPYALNSNVTVRFVDNTGTTINLPDGAYTILDTPWVTGNGADETRDAVAGVAPRCARVGDILSFSKTASANAINGPKQIAAGTNSDHGNSSVSSTGM